MSTAGAIPPGTPNGWLRGELRLLQQKIDHLGGELASHELREERHLETLNSRNDEAHELLHRRIGGVVDNAAVGAEQLRCCAVDLAVVKDRMKRIGLNAAGGAGGGVGLLWLINQAVEWLKAAG